MIGNNRGRQVLVNEDALRQLLEQAQPRERQMLVPTQSAAHDEYSIIDEDSIRDDELTRYTDGAEINVNDRNALRNRIPRATYG